MRNQLKLRNSWTILFALKLSIVIVNYNVKCLLEQCLLSVQKAIAGIEAELFVVDNASTDDSKNYLTPRFPNVKFRWNETNIGFSKANNMVLPEATGDYILFLNPDTIVPEDALQQCISFFETHHDCGALGVRMVNGKGQFLKESKRGFPSPLVSLFKMIGLHRVFPNARFVAKYYEGHLAENQINCVDVLSGAFMMLSRDALKIVKGFDEQFFMYGEDIDLSYRIQQAGFQNYYFPTVTILHYKGESTAAASSFYIHHFYSAMAIFAKKHFNQSKVGLWFILAGIKLAKTFAQIKSILSR